MPAKFTFTRNQNAIIAFADSSSKKLLTEVLPLVKTASHQEALSSMTSPQRDRPRYPADFGNEGAGNSSSGPHRSLRDLSTYQINQRSRGRGNNVGSVTAASAHAKVVHDGRAPIGGKNMRWFDGRGYISATSVRGRDGNPWMRRGLQAGVDQSRYLDSIGFNPSAGG